MAANAFLDIVGTPTFMARSSYDLTVGCGFQEGGALRLSGDIAEININSMVAAGTTQADAAILSYTHNIVAGSATNAGVKLPLNAKVGHKIYVINRGVGGNVRVYPPTDGRVNLLAANAHVTLNSANSAEFVHEGSNRWFVATGTVA